MNTVAIDYIWQVIRDSERSDEIQLSNNEFLIRAAAARLARRRTQSEAAAANPIAKAAISPTLPMPG